MIKDAIVKLTQKQDLTKKEMQLSIEEIMQGKASPVQISSFLTASIIKGITVEELTAAATVMRDFSRKVKLKEKVVIDTCGTGGDNMGTFNVSTVVAMIVAGAGVTVAKHGNRSVSSKCGSADLLEALGVKIDIGEGKVKDCIENVGIGFMFAPVFHPATKFAQPVRKELGFRTIFNFLGPLTNPAFVKYQLVGVNSSDLLKEYVSVLKELGSIHVMAVRGLDGLDEITTTKNTEVCELKDGKIKEFVISPGEFGIKKAEIKDILGSDVSTNVKIAKEILDGKLGPKRDIACLNAAAALYVAKAVPNIKQGFELANITIDSGRAKEKLNQLIEFTNR
ncbi:MAG: anthranilate phosphoribosyltransferase [Candidatus Omnitrophica bacterium]|nr:anthranilate phosphoribosyltransferase [Candidatus Omnitrophota bacterium]MDD5351901.1 anthranilate phosphoribosyltransferase [Candidatus Omnitrophota bacterium]MDD5550727.1 anthranilate phosphoribosyltransferase [Candidatus Omnitrophota bacterium]